MADILLYRNFLEDQRISMEVYADNLYQALIDCRSSHRIRQYRPETRFSNDQQAGKWAMRAARYWEYPAQIKRFKADLYHVTEHGYAHLVKALPPEKTIVTVHDLIPLLRYKGLINGVEPGHKPFFSEYSLNLLQKAAHIIAISEHTKKDLIRHCQCKEENISVIYSGIDTTELKSICHRSKSMARQKLKLPDNDHKLILICGQDYYKNLSTSVSLINQLQQNHKITCVHLGKSSNEWQNAKSLANSPNDIIEFSNISNDELNHLYRAVDCVLFPSWYEGFGLPPIEAMACGTPAVTSNAASLPEAVGPNSLTADADDMEGLLSALETVLFNQQRREQIIQAGLEYSSQFTWSACAKNTLSVYEKVMNHAQ